MTDHILDILCIATSLISMLSLLPYRHWVYRLSGYLALQLSVLLGVLLVIRLVAGQFTPIGILAICLAAYALTANLIRVVPYLQASKKQVPDLDHGKCKTLKIVSCNVYQENRNHPLLINLIRETGPDIFVAVETDLTWGKALESALSESHPHHLTAYRDDTYGMVVFSKFKMVQEKKIYIYNETPTLSCTIVHPDIGRTRLFVIHPKPPSPTEAETALPKDIEFLEVSKEIGQLHASEKVIVVGDLNDVAWSRSTRNFIRDSGLRDPLKGRGIFATFPTWAPIFGFPLDQLFLSSHFRIGELKKLRDVGSDHFPMYFEVGLGKDSLVKS